MGIALQVEVSRSEHRFLQFTQQQVCGCNRVEIKANTEAQR
jgi:hypothetical protein